MTQQLPSVMREEDTLPLPQEELAAQLLLHGPDRVTDRGLGEMQQLAGLREASLPREDGEGTELAGIEQRIHL